MPSEETLRRIDASVRNAVEAIQRKVTQAGSLSWRGAVARERLAEIEAETDKYLDEVMSLVEEPQLDDLLKLIRERRSNVPLNTGITNQVLGVCMQVLAFGAAGLPIGLAFIDQAKALAVPTQKTLAVISIFYGELAVISLFVLIVYILQARFRYPFLYFHRIGNAWPFFYYASISDKVSRREIQTPRATFDGGRHYAEDLMKFAGRCMAENKREQLRNELQQYFLLLSYQGYVNQFSLRLANFFVYGFSGAFVTAVAMMALIFLGYI